MAVDRMMIDYSEQFNQPVSKDSPVPLYAQVQEILSNFILEKALPEGTEFPTEAQLCDIFQVSRITTKRALDELVREGMIRRVKGVGNFVASPTEEVEVESRNYGLVADSSFDLFSNNFYSKVFQGIYESVTDEGGSLVFALSDRNVTDRNHFSGVIRSRSISALIALGSLHEDTLALLRDQKIPTVLVDDDCPGFNRVVTDNVNGAEAAVGYLVRHGHEKIGLMTSDRTTSFRQRTQGFIRAMKKAGLSCEPEWIKSVDGFALEAGFQEFLEVLSLPEALRPTALFAVNDHYAMNGVRAAQHLGLQVPQDVSIMGFDDTPYATMSNPNLTTVRVQMHRMGELAVATLRRMMESRRSEVECLILSTEVIQRDSVASCVPVETLV
ncbi:MAG: Arabinose metabolism transcriptional repressor [bacterium]|nr:MAG: Arabinose metabolism transcriptional repressor [Candidatus Hinthialibacteria bacterium OLB16]MBK7494950.1 GntR family transcriptional regulator [Candidatus Omnitrophota bacterium]MBV6480457.1 Arabinose metabolism transcriptional repressor [bacterium]MCE7907176.1 GntR family transcriptional regulator [Candidatus Omnitrophica bacterium COP1]